MTIICIFIYKFHNHYQTTLLFCQYYIPQYLDFKGCVKDRDAGIFNIEVTIELSTDTI